ncbi:hypothetical protein [Massilia phyllosphaerae]|uniref:hypothetical protein n=1 Tax=Massilia phyllosphaerae TaxID=3106034 RepID=UPI0035C8842C
MMSIPAVCIIVAVTPFQPDWASNVALEFSNTTALWAKTADRTTRKSRHGFFTLLGFS